MEVTEQTFEAETIRKSVKHPVVVELYSPRVATGQQLSDALIEIANAGHAMLPEQPLLIANALIEFFAAY